MSIFQLLPKRRWFMWLVKQMEGARKGVCHKRRVLHIAKTLWKIVCTSSHKWWLPCHLFEVGKRNRRDLLWIRHNMRMIQRKSKWEDIKGQSSLLKTRKSASAQNLIMQLRNRHVLSTLVMEGRMNVSFLKGPKEVKVFLINQTTTTM
jgi:hypothetical protein